MTIQETIEFLENKKRHDPYSREEYDTAIEACRRQEAKKARTTDNPVEVNCFDGEDKAEIFLCYPCPECGKWIAANENHRYCEWCGQKLDWSV